MSNPKKHHYVPQFYLQGFVDPKSGRLEVFDLVKRERRSGTPASEGYEKHLYRVEGPNPAVAEEGFAKIEGYTKTLLSAIESTRQLPYGEEFDAFLMYVALQVLRVPRTLRAWERVDDQIARHMLSTVARDDETFISITKRARAAGHTVPAMEREAFLKSLDGIDFRMNSTANVQTMLALVEDIAVVLKERQWSLLEAPRGSDFITSDSPVNVAPLHGNDLQVGNAGFGLAGTVVSFPLTRHLALLGAFKPGGVTIPLPIPSEIDFHPFCRNCTRPRHPVGDPAPHAPARHRTGRAARRMGSHAALPDDRAARGAGSDPQRRR